jgi:hypothetical protein
VRRAALTLAVAASLSGCGNANVLSPIEVAQNYVYAVAEGKYPGACALLEARTRAGLVSSARLSCPRLLARCLPTTSTSLSHDQVQLLYANADLQVHGTRADVRLSGTAVAKQAKEVTLLDEHTTWRLTSPGRAIARCAATLSRRHRRGHRRRSAHG